MDDTGFSLNPKVYDFLRWLAYVVLPAFATLLAALGLILNWGSATSVVGIVTIIDTFLGTVLNKSAKNYQIQNTLGDLVVMHAPDGVTGMKVVATKEDPVFKDGGQVLLNVRREQQAPE